MIVRAFLAITAQTFWNRIAERVRRMKDPRYAIGTLFAIAYFGWLFFKNRNAGKVFALLHATDLRIDILSAVAFFIMLFAWALPGDSGGLEFSEAEIAFLFPAPLRRRDLLLYKIIRAQPQALISAAAMTVVGLTGSHFIGLWLAFTTLGVYFTLVTLGRARLRLAGISWIKRLVAVVAIAIGIGYAIVRTNTISLRGLHTYQDVMPVLHSMFAQPLPRKLLFVPRTFAAAVFPLSNTMLLLACTGLVLLAITFFVIADRLNVSFEEASLVVARSRQAIRRRLVNRQPGMQVVFPRIPAPPLRDGGRPEVAIVWKNVIAMARTSFGIIVIFSIIIVMMFFAGSFFHGAETREASATMFLIFACTMPFLGPAVFANDLRLDLPRFEVLKSYPLTGERVVAAEIAAPLVVIAAIEIAALAGFFIHGGAKLSFVSTTELMVCTFLFTIPVCALQLLVRNAAPVVFPAWATRSKEDVRGFVVAGQRLLILSMNLAVLGVALLPAAIVLIPCILIAQNFLPGNPIGIALSVMPAVAILAFEVWLGIRFLGGRFDALDVSVDVDVISV